MSFKDDNDKPPTSKDDAQARRVRPPPEKYDPDNVSHWSITMTLAWIIWGEIDAVRNECDSYRENCADWRYVPDATARAKVAGVAMMNISTGKIAPFDPDLQKKLQKKLPKKLRRDFQKGSWHLCSWKPSGWNTLPASEHMRPQVAIDELWKAAGEGRIQAIAIKCENAKAFDGNLIKIPADHWAYLNRASEPSGKPMLSGLGLVYREVRFPRLDVKKLWPKSPPLSGEPLEPGAAEVLPEPERVEAPEPTRPAEPELLEPKARPTPESPQSKRAERYIKKHYPDGTDGVSTPAIRRKFLKDKDLQAELEKEGGIWGVPSAAVINRVLRRRQK